RSADSASRSAARPSTRALNAASLASMVAAPSITAMLANHHTAIGPSSGCASFPLLRDAGQQVGERRAVDVDRNRTAGRSRQLEHRPMETLVEQAQPVSVEPEHLETR